MTMKMTMKKMTNSALPNVTKLSTVAFITVNATVCLIIGQTKELRLY